VLGALDVGMPGRACGWYMCNFRCTTSSLLSMLMPLVTDFVSFIGFLFIFIGFSLFYWLFFISLGSGLPLSICNLPRHITAFSCSALWPVPQLFVRRRLF
jgi:hypothetical protein